VFTSSCGSIALFTPENQYCHFRTMTYRLENRGERFSGKAADLP